MPRSAHSSLTLCVLATAFGFAACTSSGGGGGDKTLAAPTGLTTTAGEGKITISWNDVEGADSYTLYFANSSGGQSSINALTISSKVEGATSPYEHNYLIYGESYYYTVATVNDAGEGDSSSEVSATPDRLPLANIIFTDENFEACVMTSTEAASENDGAEFADEIDTLTDESGDCASVTSSEVEAAVDSAASHLTSLTALILYYTGAVDLSPLSPLIQLTYLDMGYNHFTDVSPVASLTQLEEVYLGNPQGTGAYSGVRDLTTLTKAETISFENSEANLPCDDLAALQAALPGVVDPATADDPADCSDSL